MRFLVSGLRSGFLSEQGNDNDNARRCPVRKHSAFIDRVVGLISIYIWKFFHIPPASARGNNISQSITSSGARQSNNTQDTPTATKRASNFSLNISSDGVIFDVMLSQHLQNKVLSGGITP